jgi:hypothetical protein
MVISGPGGFKRIKLAFTSLHEHFSEATDGHRLVKLIARIMEFLSAPCEYDNNRLLPTAISK